MKILLLIILTSTFLFGQVINTEDFEGSGAPSNWSATLTPNYDYTADPLEKTESLYLDASTERAIYSFTADSVGEIWGFCMFKYDQTVAGTNTFIQLYFNTTQVAQIYIRDGTRIQLNLTGGNGLGTADMNDSTKIYFWWYYKQSTGSDGIFRSWKSITPIKPETPDVNLTSHSRTEKINEIRYWGHANTIPVCVDYAVVSKSEIGDYVEGTTSGFPKFPAYPKYGGFK